MHLKRLLVLPLAAGLLVAGSSMASAGEITGTGERTGANTKSNSECAFSGLEDGQEDPTAPAGPGATPQNWGSAKKAALAGMFGPDFDTMEELKAGGVAPGTSCNGHLSGRK